MPADLQIYLGDRLVDVGDATVSVFDAGFQSGDAVWEGLRAYRGTVHQLDRHLARLEETAHALRIALPGTRSDLAEAIRQTLEANGLTDGAHIRLMVTRGRRSTSGMDPRNAPAVGLLVIIAEHKPVAAEPAPLRLRTASMRRPQPQVLDPTIHHANQLNSILARLEVMDDDRVDAALLLDTAGFVAEADTANVFCVRGGVVCTPPATACLPGVTRASVLELCRDAGIAAREQPLTLRDLYGADEVFLTGTQCELVPVVCVDGRTIGTGQPGPVWRSLLSAYRALTEAECA